MSETFGKGRAEAITDDDFAALAREIGCHPADLEAIAEVESGGFGWFSDGRIKILFEKHIFYRYLPDDEKRARAVKEGLARRHWISPKKGGYKEQHNAQSRYSILAKAWNIDPDAALMSISIGKFQIMGFNYAMCGFPSVHEMWEQFLDSEANQLRAFATYLRKAGLYPALRVRDFEAVEEGYNGGGLNGAYARKMRSKAEALRRGKWAGWEALEPPPGKVPPAHVILRAGMRGKHVRELQVDLGMLGYPAGKIDGIFGPKTVKAVREFQYDQRLYVDGVAGPKTLGAIEAELEAVQGDSADSGVMGEQKPKTAQAPENAGLASILAAIFAAIFGKGK